MTGTQIAESLRKIAKAVETFDELPFHDREKVVLDEATQLGAAAMLSFLRDCLTVSSKDTFTRDELLVLLTDLMSDPEFFTIDLVRAFEMEDE